jgi:hypothetical protein
MVGFVAGFVLLGLQLVMLENIVWEVWGDGEDDRATG